MFIYWFSHHDQSISFTMLWLIILNDVLNKSIQILNFYLLWHEMYNYSRLNILNEQDKIDFHKYQYFLNWYLNFINLLGFNQKMIKFLLSCYNNL
jgi:hypothetical protein